MENRLTQRSILTEGAPQLTQSCRPWDFDRDGDYAPLGHEMIRCAKHGGMGLAAPQLGEMVRLIVVRSPDDTWSIYANPRLLDEGGGRPVEYEGCLSFPGMRLPVRRARVITAAYSTPTHGDIGIPMSGIEARIFQHELDHLDGLTILHRAPPMAVNLARKGVRVAR